MEFSPSDLGLNLSLSDVGGQFWKSMPPELLSKLSFILDIVKVIFIVWLIYLVFVIIGKIMKLRDSRNIARIERNVEEIKDLLTFGKKKVSHDLSRKHSPDK